METKKLTELIKQLDEAIGGESSLTTYRGSLVLTAATLSELKEIKDQIIASAKSQADSVDAAKAFNIALIDRIKEVASIKFPDAIQVSNFPDSFKATGIPSKVKLDDESIKKFVTKQDISEALLIDMLNTLKSIAKIIPNTVKYEGKTGDTLRVVFVDTQGKEYDMDKALEGMAKVIRSYPMGSGIAQTTGTGGSGIDPVGLKNASAVQINPATEDTLALIKAKTDNIDVLLSTRTKPADQQHVIIDSGSITADTELPAAAALADDESAATAVPTVGARMMGFDGANWDRARLFAAGQAAMAASFPVVIASNQSAIPVTQSTSPWIVAGGGTAGAAASGVVTVQGIASMTPVQVSQATAANLNATVIQGTATNLKTQAENYQGGTAVGAGNPLQVSLANHGANAVAVKVDGSAVTQPISGTVTANQGTAHASEKWRVNVIDPIPAGTNNIGDVDIASIAAGDNNIGNVDIVTVPADPFGVNADAASATGSISAKLRHLAANGIAGMTTLPSGTNAIGKLLPSDIDVTTNTNNVKKYYSSTGAVTDGIIWSPAAGKRWHCVTLHVQISADATITIEDDLSAGDSVVIKGEYKAGSGFFAYYGEQHPLASGEDAADLIITTSAGNVYVTATGYEI